MSAAARVPMRLPLLAVLAALLVAAGTAGCGESAPATTSPGPGKAGKSAGKPYPVRGVFDRDLSATGFNHEARIGFNYIDTSPNAERIRELHRRKLKALVWLGGYDNDTCRWRETASWVRSHVKAIARKPSGTHPNRPRVGAYFIDDEPDPAACPSAPRQVRNRARLVKSIDPGPPTVMVMNEVSEMKLFAGKVDIIGLNHYPCSIRSGCNYSKIDTQAAEADRLGIRYWGVIQSFGDSWFKLPTPAEVRQQFLHWRRTSMEGYLVFAWRWPDDDESLWLANHPELQRQLSKENAR